MFVKTCMLLLSYSALVHGERKFKSKQLPSYITPCKNTPDLNQCVIRNGKQTIPALLKGDPKFKIPPLVPFHVDKVELKPSNDLTLILRELEVFGIDTSDITDASFDLKNRHFKINIFGKSFKILANYKISGQILVLPINGEGTSDFRFDDCHFEYSFDFDFIKRDDGKEYIGNVRPKVTFKVTTAHFQLDNLFNGNKELGHATNRVLNENAQQVLKDLGESISKVIEALATNILTKYFSVIPYENLILQ